MYYLNARTSGRGTLVAILLMAVLLVLSGGAGSARAKLVKDETRAVEPGPDQVFAAIAEAWENGDEEALAALVHEDGLRVTNGDYDRFTNYSPSQAFYYFKNQFQIHPTVSFRFERLQDSQLSGERMHGMVVWEYRKASTSTVQELKLVLVLTRQEDNWRLSEINTITLR